MNASTPITLNNLESAGSVFAPPKAVNSSTLPAPVSYKRIQALISDIDSQARNSIKELQALKEECRHG